jgi:ankyrin repeat protein
MVQLLIDAGASANIPDRKQNYPLHWASLRGSMPILNLLLDASASQNCINQQVRSTRFDLRSPRLLLLPEPHSAAPCCYGQSSRLYSTIVRCQCQCPCANVSRQFTSSFRCPHGPSRYVRVGADSFESDSTVRNRSARQRMYRFRWNLAFWNAID